jgi:hypothetical protein
MKHIEKIKSNKDLRTKPKKNHQKKLDETERISKEFVNKLLDDNNLPEFRIAYDRMIAQGMDDESARARLITSFVLVKGEELATKTEFDLDRFIRLLNALPYIDPEEGITGFDLDNGKWVKRPEI